MRRVGRRGRRRPPLLLDRAVVDLRREPLEHIVHGPFERMRGTIVIRETTIIVIVMHASLNVRRGRTTLRRVPPPLRLAVQRERRDARRYQVVRRLAHYPGGLRRWRPVVLQIVVDLAARNARRRRFG